MSFRDAIDVGFPFKLDTRGRMASPDREEHVRQLIELVLFTAPGERVNRPDFGCGLLELLFSPASQTAASAAEFLIQGTLQEWLDEIIEVLAVDIVGLDDSFQIRVSYRLIADASPRVAIFSAQAPPWMS